MSVAVALLGTAAVWLGVCVMMLRRRLRAYENKLGDEQRRSSVAAPAAPPMPAEAPEGAPAEEASLGWQSLGGLLGWLNLGGGGEGAPAEAPSAAEAALEAATPTTAAGRASPTLFA